MKRILAILLVGTVVAGAAHVGAGQLGSTIPSYCVAHVSFDDGVDLVDDYRCAGVAIEFHAAGVAFSPGPIWAGQWLFVDEAGQFRVGSCTFNRGIHPTIDVPSATVTQTFPNDPTGAKVAYLTWRYGDTTDNLTAAAMWAVMHFYAQDAGGTRRVWNAVAPLVPSLDMIASASGRDDIQSLALNLDAEATRYAGDWAIVATIDVSGNIDVTLTAAGQPFVDAPVTVLMSGVDAAADLRTDATGVARTAMPVAPGVMTVVASASVPGAALVYRGTPAGPDPHGAQNLVTGGPPRVISMTATVEAPIPTTTTSTTTSTTSTLPDTTTTTTTTIMIEPTTSSTTTTALPPDTTTSSTTTTLAPVAVEVVPPPSAPDTSPLTTSAAVVEVLPVPPAPPLPRTGRGSDLVSYLATALLVAGVGILGVASRRAPRRVIYTR